MRKSAIVSRFLKRSRQLAGLLALITILLSATAMAGSYELGLRMYSHGDYETAVRYLRAATREDATNPNAHYYLADSYLKLHRLSEAQAEYQKILAMSPDSQAARLSRIGLSRLRGYLDNTNNERWQSAGGRRNDAPDRFLGPYGDDEYLEEVTENGRVVRWALSKMPLKLYIERSPENIRNFRPSFIHQIKRSMDVWCGVLNHQLNYVIVDRKEEGDIQVTWTNTIDTRGHNSDGGTAYTAGLTIPKIDNDQLETMDVRIATFDIKGDPQNDDIIYAVGVHELGHALGLLGHSDNPVDIMYAMNQHVTAPSRRDINTIRKLYSEAADVNNLPANERKADPGRADEIAKRLDQTVKKMEAQAARDNMALTWLNLGVTYFQKGRQLHDGGQKPDPANPESDPAYWYKKAYEASSTAIRLEPKDPRAYQKRSLALQELGDYGRAAEDMKQAINLDRREAEYQMQLAWCMAKLGQIAQARAALDNYLLQKPGAAGSEDVKRIRQEIAKQNG